MAGKEEEGPHLSLLGAAPEEEAVTVRPVLLRRNWPDADGHLHRRQRRPQQVRFKDLEDGSTGEETHVCNAPCASATPKWRGANFARRSWPQAEPRLLPSQPPPAKGCASTAIQTSPGLQRNSWATPLCSESAWDFAYQPGGPGQDQPPASLPAHSLPPAPCHAQLCPKTCATLRPVRSPPLQCPGSPCLAQGPCFSGSPPSQHKPCPHSSHPPWTPGAIAQGPPAPPPPRPAPQQASPGTSQQGSSPLYPLAQGPFQVDPLSASRLVCNTSPQGMAPQPPHVTAPPSSATSGKLPPPPAAAASPACLGATRAAQPITCPPPENCHPPSPGPGTLFPPRSPCHSHLPRGCLSPVQAEALHHVQHLLQLVPLGRGLAEEEEQHPPMSRDPPRVVGDVRSRLQSLEGVLETSQQTIRVLLGVIQDLERKEAQRDGRCSYRTGQDIANCRMCRDCACVIYSVEHDFRQQEGRLRQVLSTIEVELSQSGPPVAATPSPPCQPLPVAQLPAKGEARKAWRKCFWFL